MQSLGFICYVSRICAPKSKIFARSISSYVIAIIDISVFIDIIEDSYNYINIIVIRNR